MLFLILVSISFWPSVDSLCNHAPNKCGFGPFLSFPTLDPQKWNKMCVYILLIFYLLKMNVEKWFSDKVMTCRSTSLEILKPSFENFHIKTFEAGTFYHVFACGYVGILNLFCWCHALSLSLSLVKVGIAFDLMQKENLCSRWLMKLSNMYLTLMVSFVLHVFLCIGDFI